VTDSPFHRRRIFIVALVLAAVTLAIYWPTRHFDFVDYDDPDYIFENPDVSHGLSTWSVEWAFVDQHSANWHPLTWISHQLDCQLFGANAGPMHFENILIHCANSILLLLLLNSLTGAFWRSVFVAALFALHPLRVESVAWISERKDVLSGLFFMLTLWFYVLHVKSQRKKLFYQLSLASFTLGLLAKPMLVSAPLILLLLDFWPLNRFQKWKPLLVEKIPFLALSIAAGIITLFAQRAGGAWENSSGIFSSIENITVNYVSYIEKLLWPDNLSFLYLRPEKIPFMEFFLSALVLNAVSIFVIVVFSKRPYFFVGWFWFLIMLLPVSGVFSLARLSIADRYTYLPSIGFYLLLTWAIVEIGNKITLASLRNFLAVMGAAMVLIPCAVLTRQQLFIWQNTETLMQHALQVDPNNYVARQNLHIYLLEKAHPELKHPRINSSSENSAK